MEHFTTRGKSEQNVTGCEHELAPAPVAQGMNEYELYLENHGKKKTTFLSFLTTSS